MALALPLGAIVAKIQQGRVLVLGEFYQWVVLEMLVRFTALFVLYAFLVFFLLGLVHADPQVLRQRTHSLYSFTTNVQALMYHADPQDTPETAIFFLLATRSQENLSFYLALLFQVFFLYVIIATLRPARRLVLASALHELQV